MRVGVQFRGTIPAGATQRWYTFNWPQQWHVIWYVVPTSPRSGAPQVEWKAEVERASTDRITYWISIKNVSPASVDVEARFAILNA